MGSNPGFPLMGGTRILNFSPPQLVEPFQKYAFKLIVTGNFPGDWYTSDDPYLAERVAFMYTHAAKAAGWYEEVTLIVWGPSAKLLAEKVRIQKKVRDMARDGVVVEACITCANDYGVTADLEDLGFVDLKPMGRPLTEYIKSGIYVLTF